MWKPGQLVTIEGKICRIKKITDDDIQCHSCEFEHQDWIKYPCSGCISGVLIPEYCNLKLVKSCTKQDK